MKSFKLISGLLMTVLIAGIGACMIMSGHIVKNREDTLIVSDVSGSVKEEWEDLSALDSRKFAEPFIVFGSSGEVLYRSKNCGTEVSYLNDIVRDGIVSVSITEGERFYGTVAFPEMHRNSYDKVRKKILIALAAVLISSAIAVASYGLYIHKRIEQPFRRMERFAGKIAEGDLDYPLFDTKEDIFGSFTQSFDIMREELRASREREYACKLREKELIASLSHDLKTPITSIKLLAELLKVKTDDEYMNEKLGLILSKAEQMDSIVSDLLEAALKENAAESVDLRYENSSVLYDLTAKLDDRSWVVQETVPECLILTDLRCLERVVGNIISNAYKYAEAPIRVSCGISGKYLETAFTDSGDGVSEEELKLITNKFYRCENVKNSGKEGSGLGLYIAATLMEQMGGGLICSCNEGGLTVTLKIPLS